MRKVGGVLAGLLLAGGVVAAAATAGASPASVPMTPASTSVDHEPYCDIPDAPGPAVTVPAGGTAVSFTLVPPGCD